MRAYIQYLGYLGGHIADVKYLPTVELNNNRSRLIFDVSSEFIEVSKKSFLESTL